MTVKRMLGAGVLAFVVTAGGFVLPPTGDLLVPPTAVVPGATPTSDAVEAGAGDLEAGDLDAGDLDAVNMKVVDVETATGGE